MPRSKHRTGRPFRRAKALMHEAYGYTCIHCGHGGAGEADHLDPVSLYPDQPVDYTRMRPSHGSNYPCPICPGKQPGQGRACNQERGTRSIDVMFKPALDW